MSEDIVVFFEQCSKLIEKCQRHFLDPPDKFTETNLNEEEEDEIKACDGASQITVSISIVSKKSDLTQLIEFERKRTEIESME